MGGRISQRDTLAGIVGGYQGTFTQSFTWSDLGVPASVTYPQKAGVGPARTVTFDLTNGWLSRVHEGATNYASSISYHANGMVNQVTRPNSTTDTLAKDANDIVRPASVTVRGPLGLTLWTTGTYAYDGSGNVKSMGSGSTTDTFFYDTVSRLLEGKISTRSVEVDKRPGNGPPCGILVGNTVKALATFTLQVGWSDLGVHSSVTYPRKAGMGPEKPRSYSEASWISSMIPTTTERTGASAESNTYRAERSPRRREGWCPRGGPSGRLPRAAAGRGGAEIGSLDIAPKQ